MISTQSRVQGGGHFIQRVARGLVTLELKIGPIVVLACVLITLGKPMHGQNLVVVNRTDENEHIIDNTLELPTFLLLTGTGSKRSTSLDAPAAVLKKAFVVRDTRSTKSSGWKGSYIRSMGGLVRVATNKTPAPNPGVIWNKMCFLTPLLVPFAAPSPPWSLKQVCCEWRGGGGDAGAAGASWGVAAGG